MKRFLDLPRQIRSAEVSASSFDPGDNTIEVIFASETPVRRRSLAGAYDEVLICQPGAVRLDRLNAGAPFLNGHADISVDDVLGVVENARIEVSKGVARIRLSTAARDADTVQKIRDGILKAVSVGYCVHAVEERKGEDGSTIPRWLVRDWEPLEISCVPIAADPSAMIRSVDRSETYRCKIEREPSNAERRARMRLRREVFAFEPKHAIAVHRTDIPQPPEVRPWR